MGASLVWRDDRGRAGGRRGAADRRDRLRLDAAAPPGRRRRARAGGPAADHVAARGRRGARRRGDGDLRVRVARRVRAGAARARAARGLRRRAAGRGERAAREGEGEPFPPRGQHVGRAARLAVVAAFSIAASAPEALPTNPLLYIGGLCGAFVVVVGAAAVQTLGVLRLGLAVVAGQTLGALAIDLIAPARARRSRLPPSSACAHARRRVGQRPRGLRTLASANGSVAPPPPTA